MRTGFSVLCKLLWGASLVLTSVYCLLAFLPYTYVALIKFPAYAWMPWFARQEGPLYCVGLFLIGVMTWSEKKNAKHFFIIFGPLTAFGLYFIARPFMPGLQNNWSAYAWSLAGMAPLLIVSVMGVQRHWPGAESKVTSLFPYSNAVLIAVSVALLSGAAVTLKSYFEKRSFSVNFAGMELAGWSVLSHVLVAILVLSVLNLICILVRRTRSQLRFSLAASGLLFAAALGFGTSRLLGSALSFHDWPMWLYAGSLATTITMLLGSLALPFLQPSAVSQATSRRARAITWVVLLVVSGFALAVPTVLGGGDWNGILQGGFTLFLWITLCVCIFVLRPARTSYSIAATLTVLLLSIVTYKGLQATEIFWSKALGSTDDEIARSLQSYAAQDVSFQLVHYILGNAREEPCADLCRILRQYTNIRDAEVKTDLRLVEQLTRTNSERPNIFFFVIDSLRPDYLGAYNPRVDFSPNIDALARDSIVVHNVYTQYAGTSLSEPAIWTGAQLLHAHYMQPFARVNSLEKLARADDYKMVVSWDEVLSQLLSPTDDLVKLDTDRKLWNQLEVCSTIQQAESLLSAGLAEKQPILFYTQPKNVHQFANNHLPRMTSQTWRLRDDFNNRIAYEVHQVDDCLGGFVTYLKAHALYDNSIIILTSDHGDATGEFGRRSHSLSIYPEIMRVPLIVHLPEAMRNTVVYDDSHLSALTDITPSLYYLLGHKPILISPFLGHPLFVASRDELRAHERNQLFLASDERAVYGLLMDDGKLLYTTYDSPAQSFLFDLSQDPNAEHNRLTESLKQKYDEQIIDQLRALAGFYGYKPGMGSLLASAH